MELEDRMAAVVAGRGGDGRRQLAGVGSGDEDDPGVEKRTSDLE
jgi:hypothetical protein